MTHVHFIEVRFADTDAAGHVNNAAYATYGEAGRIAFLEACGLDVAQLILARIEIDFRRQLRFGDEVGVESAVERVGNSSVTVRQTVRANDEVAAELRSVVVNFDYDAERPARIPDEARDRMRAYVAKEGQATSGKPGTAGA